MQHQIAQAFSDLSSMTIEQRRYLIRSSGSSLKWVEIPVDLKTFVEGAEYLSHPPLSPIQHEAVYESSELFDISAAETDQTKVIFRSTQYIESCIVWGKGCVSESTRLQNAVTGKVKTAREWANSPSLIPVSALKFSPGARGMGRYRKAGWKSSCSDTTGEGVFSRGHGQMYRVTTRAGFQVDVYKRHLFMTRPLRQFGNRPRWDQWRELADLNTGDWIAMSAKTTVSQGTELPEDHIKLLAYWIGDAALSRMQMIASSQDVIDEYCDIVNRAGCRPVVKKKSKNSWSIDAPSRKRGKGVKNPLYEIAIKYKLAERVLKGLKAKTAHEKRVPIEIFALPDHQLRIFIERLWSTDGYLSATNAPEIGYTSANVDLVRDVQQLLLRFGIVGRIQEKRVRKPVMKDGKIIQRAGEFGTYYTLRMRSIDMCRRFVEEFNVPGKSIDLSSYPKGRGKYHDGAVFWDKIAKIEPIGEGEYYDLTVPIANTYAAHGFWNHNSGKDLCAMIILSRILYLLGCLTNPHEVFDMPEHVSIDILNMALGEDQALRVFFAPWKRLISKSPWFMKKLGVKLMSTSIRVPPIIGYDKDTGDMYAINAWCGNSSQEGAEGKNLLCCILDEVDGFRDIRHRKGSKNLLQTGTAQGMYNAMTASVQSRFPGIGKMVLISWPRYRGSFIERQLAQGKEEPSVFTSGPHAVWEVNPKRTEEEFAVEFRRNPEMAVAMFAARPGAVSGRYFTNSLAILNCFYATQKEDFSVVRNEDSPGPEPPVDFETMTLIPGAIPAPDTRAQYCIHVDLAVVGDRAGFAMSHHVGYIKLDDDEDEEVPVVQLDVVYWWESREGTEIDFSEIRRFILSLARAGYRIVSVTFDGWESVDMKQQLRRYDQFGRRVVYDYDSAGEETPRSTPIIAERFSLDRNTEGYDTLKEVIYEAGRLRAFFCALVVEELLNLILVNGKKVDHLDTGSKDVADAVAGSVHGAIQHQSEAMRQSRYRSSGPGLLVAGGRHKVSKSEDENFAVSDAGQVMLGIVGKKRG